MTRVLETASGTADEEQIRIFYDKQTSHWMMGLRGTFFLFKEIVLQWTPTAILLFLTILKSRLEWRGILSSSHLGDFWRKFYHWNSSLRLSLSVFKFPGCWLWEKVLVICPESSLPFFISNKRLALLWVAFPCRWGWPMKYEWRGWMQHPRKFFDGTPQNAALKSCDSSSQHVTWGNL